MKVFFVVGFVTRLSNILQSFIEICEKNLKLLHIYQIGHFLDVHNPAYVFWSCPKSISNLKYKLFRKERNHKIEKSNIKNTTKI